MAPRPFVLASRLTPTLVLTVALASCGRAKGETTTPPQPAPAETDDADLEDPELEQNTFVSTSYNTEGAKARAEPEPDDDVILPEGEFVVTTPAKAKELAEAAVEADLDPKKTWKLSPVLPATWPSKEAAVVVFFYPMAPHPQRLTEYLLYTPAYRVTVALTDGATTVKKIGKRRSLGTIKETRPSSLERRELEMAEASLVYQVLGAETKSRETPYWGYLKFVHEHPKIGRDLSRRSPKFFGWLERKRGR